MKKILTVLLAAMVAVGVSAKDYKHSLGAVGGSGLGVQYKVMVTDHFTIIDEFGYLGCYAGGGAQYLGGYFGMLDQAVFAYQATCAEGDGIKLDWYAGGQVKVGYGAGNYGVIGFGAAAGIEANMKNAPIAFSFDFRPGYAVALIPGAGFGGGGVLADHMFDWTFNLGVRYTF